MEFDKYSGDFLMFIVVLEILIFFFIFNLKDIVYWSNIKVMFS